MIQLVFNIPPNSSRITLEEDYKCTSDDLKHVVTKHLLYYYGNSFDFYLINNGKFLNEEKPVHGEIHVIPRLLGGKGGFGSMLRAIGAQIEKTTNREACRDLSGRRLRDINEEKRLKKWIAEQAEREQEALARKKRKHEKLSEIIKHEFNDTEYLKSRSEMPEKIHESVEEGLKVAVDEPSSSKEVSKKPKEKKIRGNLWVDDLEILSDSASSSENEDEVPKKKIKAS